MKKIKIKETERSYEIRIKTGEGMTEYEDIDVYISSDALKPNSKFFTHCELKINMIKHRTIDEHIGYLKNVISGLEELKEEILKEEEKRHFVPKKP